MQATGSLDALVAFNGLRDAGARSQDYIKEVARVLKPGAPFIFFDRGAPPNYWFLTEVSQTASAVSPELYAIEITFPICLSFSEY